MYNKNVANNQYMTEFICPWNVRMAEGISPCFWQRAFGAKIDNDVPYRKLCIKGGTWSVFMKNMDNSDAHVDAWLGFVYDGATYQNPEGATSTPWTPWSAGSVLTSFMRISKYHRKYTLKLDTSKDGNEESGGTCRMDFKVPWQLVDCHKWVADKKGWPILMLSIRGQGAWHTRVQIQVELNIQWCELNNTHMNMLELKDIARQFEALKKSEYTMETEGVSATK